MAKFKEMEEQLKANAMLMQDFEKTFEERLAEAKAKNVPVKTEDKVGYNFWCRRNRR